MTILITGAAGYLGRHLVEKMPTEMLVLLDRSPSLRDRFPDHKLYISDLSDISELTEIIISNSITSVVHLAALKSVSDSILAPDKTLAANIVSTFNLLEASRKTSVKSFIFASSAAVYAPLGEKNSLKESDVTLPGNPYGMSKLIGEKLISSYSSVFNVASLRFFNLIGSSSIANVDKLGENFLPIAMRAIQSQSRINIFGNSFDTVDGFAVRDFIDVRDAARAIKACLEFTLSNESMSSIALNISSNTGTSIGSLLAQLKLYAPNGLEIDLLPPREGEVPFVVGDSSLANEVLNWYPKISALESINDDIKHFFGY
jgi:UDP-glucose 4-epimerase